MKKTASLILLAAFFIIVKITANGGPVFSPIIRTQSGLVRGHAIQVKIAPKQRVIVYQFTAIPYALPPIGQLRFRKTLPIFVWQGVINATKWPNACTQNASPFMDDSRITGSEDCLYLNIWVPKATLDNVTTNNRDVKFLPCFVFITGDSFHTGSSKNVEYNGRYLSAFNNIIVVTIQYRLGSLGFGYLGNDDVPGNAGLWDQLEALKWVNDNIGAFGGNNQQITIGGSGAGAVSVSWHMLSPISRRYFQRAIIQSGTALSPWGSQGPETALASTNMAFQQVCNIQSTENKAQCLRSADAKQFPLADDKVAEGRIYEQILHPVAAGGFIPADPMTMLLRNDFHKIPLLIGATEDEGSLYVAASQLGAEILPSFIKPGRSLDDLGVDHYNALMHDRFKNYGNEEHFPVTPSSMNRLVVDAVRMHYWPRTHEGNPEGEEVFHAVADAEGDYGILCPTYVFANITAQVVPNVFAYYFTQRRDNDPSPEFMGVTHSSEMPFVFGLPLSQQYGQAFSDQERHFSRTIMSYWGNFIKTGDPNGNGLRKWPPYTGKDCSRYFELSMTPRTPNGVICDLKERDCLFWYDYLAKLTGKKQPLGSPERYIFTTPSTNLADTYTFTAVFTRPALPNFMAITSPKPNYPFIYSKTTPNQTTTFSNNYVQGKMPPPSLTSSPQASASLKNKPTTPSSSSPLLRWTTSSPSAASSVTMRSKNPNNNNNEPAAASSSSFPSSGLLLRPEIVAPKYNNDS